MGYQVGGEGRDRIEGKCTYAIKRFYKLTLAKIVESMKEAKKYTKKDGDQYSNILRYILHSERREEESEAEN